jgi:GTP cyclohydrolase I
MNDSGTTAQKFEYAAYDTDGMGGGSAAPNPLGAYSGNRRNYAYPVDIDVLDVQGLADNRALAIDRVGIRSIRHPVQVTDRSGETQHTVARFDMYVYLPASARGAHMSRFVKLLNDQRHAISVKSFQAMVLEMIDRLEAESGHLEINFPYFVKKTAPVSGVTSLMDYDVALIGESKNGLSRFSTKVIVPVTSLCPCSKQISKYGAHNQRSHVTVTVRTSNVVWIEELIRIVELRASCELYAFLKRTDEKYVTEYAYDHPKFVEDMVRDVATALNKDPRIDAYVVESENFEAIHNHSAYALIEREKTGE